MAHWNVQLRSRSSVSYTRRYVRTYYTDAAALNPFLAQSLQRSERRGARSQRGGQPVIGAAVPLWGRAVAEEEAPPIGRRGALRQWVLF